MEQQRIWDYFENEALDSFQRSRARCAACARAALRRHRARGAVVNVGIGAGIVERIFLEKGWAVSSLDLSERAVARLRTIGIDARRGLLQEMPFGDRQFDAVIATEVLEHIPQADRMRGIAEVARVLRPHGWFIGTVPYRENLSDGKVICPTCGTVFHRWGHADSFDARKIRVELAEQIETKTARPRAFVDWALIRTPLALARGVAKLVLGRMGEGVVHPNLYFEARRKC